MTTAESRQAKDAAAAAMAAIVDVQVALAQGKACIALESLRLALFELLAAARPLTDTDIDRKTLTGLAVGVEALGYDDEVKQQTLHRSAAYLRDAAFMQSKRRVA